MSLWYSGRTNFQNKDICLCEGSSKEGRSQRQNTGIEVFLDIHIEHLKHLGLVHDIIRGVHTQNQIQINITFDLHM